MPIQKQSTVGGLPALEALAQQFGLWQKVRRLPGLDPRIRTSHGYSPELIVAQFLYCFWTGGASLADAERLNDEPLARQLARVEKFADQTQLGQWLRAQSPESIAAIWRLIAEFIEWVIARAEAARWTYAGRAEVFFDDTQIEVHGPRGGCLPPFSRWRCLIRDVPALAGIGEGGWASRAGQPGCRRRGFGRELCLSWRLRLPLPGLKLAGAAPVPLGGSRNGIVERRAAPHTAAHEYCRHAS